MVEHVVEKGEESSTEPELQSRWKYAFRDMSLVKQNGFTRTVMTTRAGRFELTIAVDDITLHRHFFCILQIVLNLTYAQ